MKRTKNILKDVNIIKDATVKVFDYLKAAYDFEDDISLAQYNLSRNFYIAISKNNVIIYAFISNREGYQISILRKDEPKYMSRSFKSFFYEKFKPNSKEIALLRNKRKEELKDVIENSFEYYEKMILWEINFLKKYYPDIILKGYL